MNILLKANKIVNERSEDKTRRHGDYVEGAEMMKIMSEHIFKRKTKPSSEMLRMILLKISRIECGQYLEDHFIDLAGYVQIYHNLKLKENE